MSDEARGAIKSVGVPRISEEGREIFSFHLYRYLSPWLREAGCERVLVSLGFCGSEAEPGAYQISASRGQAVQVGWTHEDLEDAWRYGSGSLTWESSIGGPVEFLLEPLHGTEELLGFLMVRRDDRLDPLTLERLGLHAAEAVAVARRNSVRLFFEDHSETPIKELLYAMMDRLPEWVGCDHSAGLVLTDDLDAMTLEESPEGVFNVLAERLFRERGEGESPDRLVGMQVDLQRIGEPQILGDALTRARTAGQDCWCYDPVEEIAEGQGPQWCIEDLRLGMWHRVKDRPGEGTVVVVALNHQSRGEKDLLGFLTLAFRRRVRLSQASRELLREIGVGLAARLKPSPLYTMSVRKMWVLQKIRTRVEALIAAGERGEPALDALIGELSGLVAKHVDIPAFAVGRLIQDEGRRTLRYVHPHGWTRYTAIDLDVDVGPEGRVDSGISALAIRLGRPVVLAGGHGVGADQEFKNFLWVHEEAGEIYDARGITGPDDPSGAGCTRLKAYYKSAREESYATLAYPIVFAGVALGVLTVEVEKDTDWIWWTGFGGHLFWEMVAREVALGLNYLAS